METSNNGMSANILLSLGRTDFSQLLGQTGSSGTGLTDLSAQLPEGMQSSEFGQMLSQQMSQLEQTEVLTSPSALLANGQLQSELGQNLSRLNQQIGKLASGNTGNVLPLAAAEEASSVLASGVKALPEGIDSDFALVEADSAGDQAASDQEGEEGYLQQIDQQLQTETQAQAAAERPSTVAQSVGAQQVSNNSSDKTKSANSLDLKADGKKPGAINAAALSQAAASEADSESVEGDFVPVTASDESESLSPDLPNTKPQTLAAQLKPQGQALTPQASAEMSEAVTSDLELADESEMLSADELAAKAEKSDKSARKNEQIMQLDKNQQMWGDKLSERISLMAGKKIQTAIIHLDPPELGSLEIKMQITPDQTAQVQVQAQTPQIREALESSSQRLKEMLEQQGIELDQFDVSDQSSFAQSQGDGQSSEQGAGGEEFFTGEEGEILSQPALNGYQGKGMLDTFA